VEFFSWFLFCFSWQERDTAFRKKVENVIHRKIIIITKPSFHHQTICSFISAKLLLGGLLFDEGLPAELLLAAELLPLLPLLPEVDWKSGLALGG
jgi:hypothetical protein